MKKYYDKILFLLGLAVLGIGAGIFFYKGGLPVSTPLPPMRLSGTAFESIASPNLEEPSAEWEAPPDQGEDLNETGWTYSVFTPPKIWWETGEGWSAIPPQGAGKTVPFGIRLIDAKKDLYRVQLVGSGANGDDKDVAVFTDVTSGYGFELREGEENQRHQVKLLTLTVGREEKPHGIVKEVVKATILDEQTNQNVDLVSDEPYSPTNNEFYDLKISAPYPEQDWKVTKVDDSIDLFPDAPNKGKFVVVALDFDKPSVTVDKHSYNKKGREIITKRELMIVDDSAPPPQPAKPGKPTAKPAM